MNWKFFLLLFICVLVQSSTSQRIRERVRNRIRDRVADRVSNVFVSQGDDFDNEEDDGNFSNTFSNTAEVEKPNPGLIDGNINAPASNNRAVDGPSLTECSVSEFFNQAKVSTFTNADYFGLSLFKALALSKANSVFISPFGVFSVLSLALAGAKGPTKQKLRTLLDYGEDDVRTWKIFSMLNYR